MRYEELLEDKRMELEAQYVNLSATGDLQGAWDTLGEMMAFNFIQDDDMRLSKKYVAKMKAAGVETDKRFAKDVRPHVGGASQVEKRQSFLPDNLIINNVYFLNTEFKIMEHWTKRNELQYTGDIICPERELSIQLVLADTLVKAQKWLEEIQNLYKKLYGRGLRIRQGRELLLGSQKIYAVKLAPGTTYSVRDFGYAVVETNGNGGVRISMILDNQVLLDGFIDIGNAYDKVKSTLVKGLVPDGSKNKQLETHVMGDLSDYKKAQRERMAKQPKTMQEFVDIENKKIEEQREKEEAQKASGKTPTFVDEDDVASEVAATTV